MEWLNDWDEGFIQHERQMDGKSCDVHVIEVKKFKILSKPKKPLTLIEFQYLSNYMQMAEQIMKLFPTIPKEILS